MDIEQGIRDKQIKQAEAFHSNTNKICNDRKTAEKLCGDSTFPCAKVCNAYL